MTAKQRRKQFKVAIDFDHTLYDTVMKLHEEEV